METFYENLKLFDGCMKRANISYWVGEGTALGFVRERGMIEGDSDVDVGIYYHRKIHYYMRVLPQLLACGFTVIWKFPHSVIRKGIRIDVDFIAKGRPARTIEWPQLADPWFDLLEPFQKINVRGIKYNVPSIEYIKYLYGEDYMTPKPGFKPVDVER